MLGWVYLLFIQPDTCKHLERKYERSYGLVHLCRSCSHHWSLRSHYRHHRPSGPGYSAHWCTGTGCWRRNGCSPLRRCHLRSRPLNTCTNRAIHAQTDQSIHKQALNSTLSIFKSFLSGPESQCQVPLMHRPLEQLNWVRGSQVGKAEKVWVQVHIKYNANTVTQYICNQSLFSLNWKTATNLCPKTYTMPMWVIVVLFNTVEKGL